MALPTVLFLLLTNVPFIVLVLLSSLKKIDLFMLTVHNTRSITQMMQMNWNVVACDHEGRRRAMRTREGTLVANVGQYAMLRGRQDAEYLELHEIIEYINEKRGRLLVTIERKQKLMSGASETFREHLFQEIRDVDDRISA